MNVRRPGLPLSVFADLKEEVPRCINGLHVQTFIPNPFGHGTLITFTNGDTVTVGEGFEAVFDELVGDGADG